MDRFKCRFDLEMLGIESKPQVRFPWKGRQKVGVDDLCLYDELWLNLLCKSIPYCPYQQCSALCRWPWPMHYRPCVAYGSAQFPHRPESICCHISSSSFVMIFASSSNVLCSLANPGKHAALICRKQGGPGGSNLSLPACLTSTISRMR